MALGDSTVYGLGATHPTRHYVARLFDWLRGEYPNARLHNHGTCLATAADVLAHQVPEAVLKQPDLVTVSIGPNDLRQGHSPQDFARRVEVILERLDRETQATVIVNSLPDLSVCPRFPESERSLIAALTRHYNHALQHVADGFGIDLVRIGIADRTEDERRRFFCDDGYHPSDEGYLAWARTMWAAVTPRIPERRFEWPRLAARTA